jgi:hypothetical protein
VQHKHSGVLAGVGDACRPEAFRCPADQGIIRWRGQLPASIAASLRA